MNSLFKNFSFALVSNILNLIISILIILVVPKYIGVYEYGLWQVFIFYNSYVGLLHLGWIDGIYLRYGGKKFSELSGEIFQPQLFLFILLQVVFSVLLVFLSLTIVPSYLVPTFQFLSITIIVNNCKDFFQFILQLSNKIPSYAISNVVGTVFYGFGIFFLIINNSHNYKNFIIIYVISQLISLLLSFFFCKSLFKFSKYFCKFNFNEIYINIKVGAHLVISNISSMLIIGFVRFVIQVSWSVEQFGKISLMLSISNFVMVFINSISLILFPALRFVDKHDVNKLYSILHKLVTPLLLCSSIIYYPLYTLISVWLPNYSAALIYLPIIFPVIILQAKFEILSNTFLKVLRMEKFLLLLNIISLLVAVILTIFVEVLLHNLFITLSVIIVSIAIRDVLADFLLGKKLNSFSLFETLQELIIILFFVLFNIYFTFTISMLFYSLFLLIYFVSIKKGFMQSMHDMGLYLHR